MAITSHFDTISSGMKARIDPASRLPKRAGLLQSSHAKETTERLLLSNKPTRTPDIKNHSNINRSYR